MILGISGNFKGHLSQLTDEKVDMPRCIFPIYAKGMDGYLDIDPVSENYLRITKEFDHQIEPEISLFLEVEYRDGIITNLKATHFSIFNDCSIRSGSIKKISLKKNWGALSKGGGGTPKPLYSYSEGSELEKLRLVSFVKRNDTVYQYNEDCSINEYTFKYEHLLSWIKNTINTQKETEVKDNIINILKVCGYPECIQIAIGATRYTDFGKKNFLKLNDEIFILLYQEDEYHINEIEKMIIDGILNVDNIISIRQKVII